MWFSNSYIINILSVPQRSEFYDRTTVHRNKFLVNKTKRCTEFQFYWYNYSTRFRQPFCPSWGVLSQTSALVLLCSCDHLLPGVGWHTSAILLLVANGSSQLHKIYQSRCTARNSWWWAEKLPETCSVVIPIKLEFGASVGFIHRESTKKFGFLFIVYQYMHK